MWSKKIFLSQHITIYDATQVKAYNITIFTNELKGDSTEVK